VEIEVIFRIKIFVLTGWFFLFGLSTMAQHVPEGKIHTGATFLGINPDVRSGGMGETGVATKPDLSAIAINPAKLPFVSQQGAAVVSYSPWMPSLSRDIYLAYLGGFYKINESSVLGSSLRYFSYGKFELSDQDYNTLGEYKPIEYAYDICYGRKFGPAFGIALTGRYIYSGLASSNPVVKDVAESGSAFAVDVGFYQNSSLTLFGSDASVATGVSLSNLGTKLNYGSLNQKELLPANLRVGSSVEFQLDDKNLFSVAIDVNKLLVPHNSSTSSNDESTLSSYFRSFSDSSGGFTQGLRGLAIGTGFEYSYSSSFAFRGGYHYENPAFGYRRYFTFGTGMKYKNLNFDFSYIAASPQENPLAGTMRMGFGLYL